MTTPAPKLYAHMTLWTTGAPVRTAWSASDPSGITQDELRRSTAGGEWSGVGLAPATATSVTQTLAIGTAYAYQVRATDGAANTSDWKVGPAVTPLLTHLLHGMQYVLGDLKVDDRPRP